MGESRAAVRRQGRIAVNCSDPFFLAAWQLCHRGGEGGALVVLVHGFELELDVLLAVRNVGAIERLGDGKLVVARRLLEHGCQRRSSVRVTRKNRLAYLKQRVIGKLTGKATKDHEQAHKILLEVATKAAAKTRVKNSVVSVAPEVDPEDQAAPPIPAGRKSLRVVN